jgi:hypothetical protein
MTETIYIYGLINPINNTLFYVGYTNNMRRRLNEHIKYKYNHNKDLIIENIISCGKNIEIVEIDSTPLKYNQKHRMYEHDLLEIKWIERVKLLGHNLTNMSKGGSGYSNEGINVFEYNSKGEFIKEYFSLSEAAKQKKVSIPKLSLALDQKINKSSCGSFWFSSKKLAESFEFFVPHQKARKIVAYNLNGTLCRIFNTQVEAEKITGIKSRQINKCLKNNNKKRAGNYQWFYYNENSPQKIKEWINPQLKPVYQYDLNDEFLKKYDSIKEAAKINNITYTTISKCCYGKLKTASGYKWKNK